jgi:hypothetical protein
VPSCESVEFFREQGVPAECEIGVDPLLDHCEAELLQPFRRGSCENLVLEIREAVPLQGARRLVQ